MFAREAYVRSVWRECGVSAFLCTASAVYMLYSVCVCVCELVNLRECVGYECIMSAA